MKQLRIDVREMVFELIEYRELLLRITARDLLLRYKQTVMGFGWAIFMPIVNTAVFSVIFTRVAPIDTGVPYPLFAFSGLLVWNCFASALRFSAVCLTSNTNLVTKVYFPREIFPLSAVIVSAVDFVVGFIVLGALMAYYHVPVTPALIFLPLVFAVHIVFTMGIALLLSMANLFYRDVKYLFEIVITVWMFATSVVYPTELVGGRLGTVLTLNPMTSIIDGYRSVILRGQLPSGDAFGLAVIVAAVIAGIAWVLFHRAEFQFAENI
jgi:ABC-type polysaccharide/polyol phosphate export permease